MVTLTNEKRHYSVTLPTSMKELNMENLLKLVENVTLNEHYLIVGLVQKFTTMNLALLSGKKNGDVVASVTPIFIKSNDPNSKIKATLGDRIISSRSDLERSIHLPINSGISSATLTQIIEDMQSVRTLLTNGMCDDEGKKINELICVEFKILPLTGVYAVVNKDVKIKDEFINRKAVE